MIKYIVRVRLQRDFQRVVNANTPAQAIKKAKQNVVKGSAKIRMKDFDNKVDATWEA